MRISVTIFFIPILKTSYFELLYLLSASRITAAASARRVTGKKVIQMQLCDNLRTVLPIAQCYKFHLFFVFASLYLSKKNHTCSHSDKSAKNMKR